MVGPTEVTTLDESMDKGEFTIELLKQILDRQQLQQKQNAWILANQKRIEDKVDSILDRKSKYRTQGDAAIARKERTWN